MDISSKYRTKCPPREHEEAVRMLLEGIGKQDSQNIDTATIISSSDIVNNNNNTTTTKTCTTSSNSFDYDDGRSIQSSSSISSDHHPTTNATNLRNPTKSNSKQHQKATSTSEDSNSIANSNNSSEIDHEARFREPIPSRTIAVQCDLKSSSAAAAMRRAGGDNLIDGSMQASSISSTRYGFYNFTPETLENRRRLQPSVSSRDLVAELGGSSLRSGQPNQIEAPTSMSELSISDSGLEGNRHNDQARPIMRNQTMDNKIRKAVTSSSSHSSSSTNSYTMHHTGGGLKAKVGANKRVLSPSGDDDLDYRGFQSEQSPARVTRSSARLDDRDSSTARAKINSLPRRPMTALSYVSTTKLREQQSPDAYLDNNNDSSERMKPIKNRTMSQQTLTRPRTPAHEYIGSSSDGLNSDSELGAARSRDEPRNSRLFNGDHHHHHNNDNVHHHAGPESKYRQQEVPRVVSGAAATATNGLVSPTKPPRPTLISSKHEEQILDYKTLDRNPNVVRPATAYQQQQQQQQQDMLSSSGHKYRPVAPEVLSSSHKSRLVSESRNEFDKFATIDRSAPLNGYRDSYDASEYTSRLRSHGRPVLMRQAFVEPEAASSTRDFSPSRREQYQALRQDYPQNSMSLSRRIKPTGSKQQPLDTSDHTMRGPEVSIGAGGGYYTASRIKPHKLSRNNRAHSQMNLQKSPSYVLPSATETVSPRRPSKHLQQQQDLSDVELTPRSTSMNQINRSNTMTNGSIYDPNMYATPVNHDSIENYPEMGLHPNDRMAFKSEKKVAREFTGRDLYRSNPEEGPLPCDLESPLTRTWANPSARTMASAAPQSTNADSKQLASGNRKTSRSFSMRDVNSSTDFNAKRYERYDDYHTKAAMRDNNNLTNYNSSSESSSLAENARRFARLEQTLDYDSQHKLNEIGLPEVNPFMATTTARSRTEGPGSYLGPGGLASYSRDTDALYTSSGRAPQITGRALSQQSLTRPTMPLSSSRRRYGGGSNHSGSDVGGSSMSLVSRLHGRYENAHTRTPVVMYIPKVMPRANSHGDGSVSLIGKSSTLRKSSRSRQKSSSQDRSRRRSSSRNGSDSESSSMLRTLVRPRSRHHANYSSKRTARIHGATMHDDEDEDIDGIGQLASEMDSYKFRRRYSVPKDAKINWFAKLKQRVSSGGK